jgi:hypothetical protein
LLVSPRADTTETAVGVTWLCLQLSVPENRFLRSVNAKSQEWAKWLQTEIIPWSTLSLKETVSNRSAGELVSQQRSYNCNRTES